MSDYVKGLREKVGTDLLFWPSVACLSHDEEGRLLLVRHVEGRWMFPAGAVDPGESPADAARREAWEEAGVLVEPLRILGVFGGPEFRITYSNGDEAAWVTTVFEARILSGTPAPSDDETAEVRWFDPADAFGLELAPSMQSMLRQLLDGRPFAEAAWTP